MSITVSILPTSEVEDDARIDAEAPIDEWVRDDVVISNVYRIVVDSLDRQRSCRSERRRPIKRAFGISIVYRIRLPLRDYSTQSN